MDTRIPEVSLNALDVIGLKAEMGIPEYGRHAARGFLPVGDVHQLNYPARCVGEETEYCLKMRHINPAHFDEAEMPEEFHSLAEVAYIERCMIQLEHDLALSSRNKMRLVDKHGYKQEK